MPNNLRLIFTTAGLAWLPVTQLTPAAIVEAVPLPEQSRARTAYSETFLATPYVLPPIVPATCVPCPLQSCQFPP
jgi:ABC-type molybdate transport system permease subunit